MITRLWSALGALGAGLILFAVAAGRPVAVALPIVLLAALHIGYALVTLRSSRPVLPRLTPVACGIATGIGAALLFTGLMGVVPFAALFALYWGIALLAVLAGRRTAASATPASTPAPRPGALIAGLASGAMIVAAITTPALSFTDPGTVAVPHGELHSHH